METNIYVQNQGYWTFRHNLTVTIGTQCIQHIVKGVIEYFSTLINVFLSSYGLVTTQQYEPSHTLKLYAGIPYNSTAALYV